VAQTQIDPKDTGVFVVGEYVGIRDQRPRTRTYNEVETTYQGCDVGLRIDGEVSSVGFPDRAAATEYVEGWAIGEQRALKVVIRHGQNANGPWLLYSAADVKAPATSFAAPGA
jgi:hypothetical protein